MKFIKNFSSMIIVALIPWFLTSCFLFQVDPISDSLVGTYDTGENCSYPAPSNGDGLLFTEFTMDWVEIFNANALSSDPICLGRYQFVSTAPNNTKTTYSLPNYPIEPQTYAVVRFNGEISNSSSDVIIVPGPGLEMNGTKNSGAFELVYLNSSIDAIIFCNENGNVAKPIFKGCIDYPVGNYLSFHRSVDLTDTDSSSDWSSSSIPTFGGKNDVNSTADNDADGIPDANEQPGTTFAGLPLYDWGARAGQKDIFVHVSYMKGGMVKSKAGLLPRDDAFDKVISIFNQNGYTVHFDLGSRSTIYNLSKKSHEVAYSTYVTIDPNANYPKVPELASAIYYKNRYMPINRFGIFHHLLFANKNVEKGEVKDDTLGIAELPGNDLVVFLGGVTAFDGYANIVRKNFMAAVVFHELGHNLDLKHGGNVYDNYKPNFFSSMNYGYTLSGVPKINDSDPKNFFNRYLSKIAGFTNKTLEYKNYIDTENFNIDYSHGVLPDIDENNVSEKNPLGNGLGDIDWNNDGIIKTGTYTYDLNPPEETSNRVLSDYDEWGNLKLPFTYSFVNYNNLTLKTSATKNSHFEHLRDDGNTPSVSCSFKGLMLGGFLSK